MAAPLLTKLDDPKLPGLQIVVTAFDGFLYAIDGQTGACGRACARARRHTCNCLPACVLVRAMRFVACVQCVGACMCVRVHAPRFPRRHGRPPAGCADSLDLGEASYAQVLADDLDGNGRLDLLVATMNGVCLCFQQQQL